MLVSSFRLFNLAFSNMNIINIEQCCDMGLRLGAFSSGSASLFYVWARSVQNAFSIFLYYLKQAWKSCEIEAHNIFQINFVSQSINEFQDFKIETKKTLYLLLHESFKSIFFLTQRNGVVFSSRIRNEIFMSIIFVTCRL